MEEIRYMLKPDSISWDEIAKCQYDAHSRNRKKGFHMSCQDLTGEQLKRSLKNAYCFVALDENNRVVGTSSIKINHIYLLWKRIKGCYYCMTAIIPEYQGTDVYMGLSSIQKEEMVKHNVDFLYFDTAEQNKLVQKLNKKKGYFYYLYKSYDSTTYYSVVMAKWTNKKVFPDWVMNSLFFMSKVYTKIRYKAGGIKRLGI